MFADGRSHSLVTTRRYDFRDALVSASGRSDCSCDRTAAIVKGGGHQNMLLPASTEFLHMLKKGNFDFDSYTHLQLVPPFPTADDDGSWFNSRMPQRRCIQLSISFCMSSIIDYQNCIPSVVLEEFQYPALEGSVRSFVWYLVRLHLIVI